jgi:hypothetical protein
MPITTLDGLIAGMLPPVSIFKAGVTAEAAGVFHSMLYQTGYPGTGTPGTPGLAGAALTSIQGQIPFPAAVGGQNIHLAGAEFVGSLAGIGMIFIMDRLWNNSGLNVTTTTAQTVSSVAWPARDAFGSINGDDVFVGIEVATATTNGSAIANTTMSYTNSAGVAGRTATMSSFPATAVQGTFIPFQLTSGDRGVRSVQNVTLGTTYGAGAIHLVAYRVIAALALPNLGGAAIARDGVQLGLPRMYDGSVPFLTVVPTTTIIGNLSGRVVYAQG